MFLLKGFALKSLASRSTAGTLVLPRYMSTLFDNLKDSVTKNSSSPLFYDTPSSFVSYGDFLNNVSKFRKLLEQHDVKHGDNIVVFGNNSKNWAGLAYAIWGEGGVIVPTYDKQQTNVKRHMINETKPKLVFNSNEVSIKHSDDTFTEINHETVVLPDSSDILKSNAYSNSIASILYTSGTTGLPKGVILTHNNIISNMKGISEMTYETPVTENDKYVSFLPWSHCYGLNCELNYLIWKGASTYINTDLTKLRENFLEHNPTILCSVPKLFHEIHKKISFGKYFPGFLNKILVKKTFGNKLRFSTIGGASVDPDLLKFYDKIGVKLIQGYGITELSPMATLNDMKSNKIGSVGKVLKDCRIKIVDGEIYVTGPNVSPGYYLDKDPESFVYMEDGQRYFKTGDGGRIDGDNFIYLTGRIKETFKLSNGKFVNPEEIEQIILTNVPSIDQVMVYAKDCDEFTSIIAVTNLVKSDVEYELNSLGIDKYKIPRNITVTREKFDIEKDLVTPKQSLKRANILKYFNLK